jgi:hypothetical protein
MTKCSVVATAEHAIDRGAADAKRRRNGGSRFTVGVRPRSIRRPNALRGGRCAMCGTFVDREPAVNESAPNRRGICIPLLIEVVDRYNEAYPNGEAKCFLELTKPTDALMQHATEAQLVVVGTRGRNALSSAILGSTG